MKFKFGDRVRVIDGFHKGRAGICVDYYDYASNKDPGGQYSVRFDKEHGDVAFKEEGLELISAGKTI